MPSVHGDGRGGVLVVGSLPGLQMRRVPPPRAPPPRPAPLQLLGIDAAAEGPLPTAVRDPFAFAAGAGVGGRGGDAPAGPPAVIAGVLHCELPGGSGAVLAAGSMAVAVPRELPLLSHPDATCSALAAALADVFTAAAAARGAAAAEAER
eukprot:32563-Chlamydomonas_euryale.AAC.1